MIKLTTLLLGLFLLPLSAFAAESVQTHGLAMHGAPKYAADFTHLDYVNPAAPKGGRLRMHSIGTFDNLNPYIVKGLSPGGTNLVFETLLESTLDEAFTAYGLLAESIEVPDDRSWVIFTLRPQAQWHDGTPVTAADVVWSFETLTTKGRPFFRIYYANVEDVEALSPTRVKFTFDMSNNRELPIIVGQMPILPKHYWNNGERQFDKTTLEPPLGSGPYTFGAIETGRAVEYKRVKDWWGKDLPLNRGKYNFDRITYDYYKDGNVALEALFAGEYDFRAENTAKLWATAYDAPAVKDGRIIKRKIENDRPQGMQGFIFNTRRPVFTDAAVREAIILAFDYEWSNKQFAFNAYTRSRSYFSNSEMEARGVPEGRELEILEPFHAQLPPALFTTEYNPPITDGSGNNRGNLRAAIKILDDAGWKMDENGVRKKDGVTLEFEFIDNNQAFERWVAPLLKNLQRIGIKANFRIVDTAQLQNRLNNFDFDMTVQSFGQSNSPGNEQREYWGSAKADMEGSRNYIGIKDPVVDALVEFIVSAPNREELVIRCRALDRVLQWGHYLIPNWHIPAWRVAYWDKFGVPENPPPYGLPIEETWWMEETK